MPIKGSSLAPLSPSAVDPTAETPYAIGFYDGTSYKIPVSVKSEESLLVTQAAHSFKVGDSIRKTSSGTTWVLAIADTVANAQAVGIVTYATDDVFTVQFVGKVTIGSVSGGTYESALSIGSIYYLSAATAGLCILDDDPIVSMPMFMALSATVALILNERPRETPIVQPAPGIVCDFGGNDDIVLTGVFESDKDAIMDLNGGNSGNPFWRVCDGTEGTPDLRGLIRIGAGERPGLTNRVLGQVIGSETVVLTVSGMPSHVHEMTALGSNAPSNGHGILAGANDGGTGPFTYNDTTDLTSFAKVGGDAPHENMPPSYVIYPIIRTSRLR